MKLSLVVLLISILSVDAFAQTYEIDVYDGMTVTTCSGTFTDSNPSTTGNYGDNEDYTVTFCSGSSSYLTFDFDVSGFYDPLSPGDTLYMYDGTSTSGDLIMKIDGSDDPAFSEFMLSTLSTCVTFHFVSDASGNNDGWAAIISCPAAPAPCNGNVPAADIALQAPYLCNLDGYCGNTSSYYHEDLPNNMIGTGGTCPSAQAFLGTIQNNSWLRFEASTTSVSMDFLVSGCAAGIQVAILQYDGSNWVRYSDCNLTDGGNNGAFTLTGTGLTVGEVYYIMADGNSGANCDYTINVNGSSGVAYVDAGVDQSICPGGAVNLSATGPTGATYVWNSLDGVVSNVVGANQTFNPSINTTYVVEVNGGSICFGQTDTVVVEVCIVLPLELLSFESSCQSGIAELTWSAASESNLDYFIIQKSTDGSSFQTVGFVNAAGNSQSVHNYSWLDSQMSNVPVSYRLIAQDLDGERKELSMLISEPCSQAGTGIKDAVIVGEYLEVHSLDLAGEDFSVELYDLGGKKVFGFNSVFNNSKNIVGLPISRMATGIYVLLIRSNSDMLTKKCSIDNQTF